MSETLVFVFVVSPHGFVFITLYGFFVGFILSVSDFYSFWFFMEVGTLLFFGVGLCLLNVGVSQFMSFLVIQTLAAFGLIVAYSVGSSLIISLAIILKLGMFPFYFWFVAVGAVFPGFYLFLSMTIFKIPSVSLINLFVFNFDLSLVYISLVLNLLVGGGLMVNSQSVRMLLIGSSVGNNSWFILSQTAELFLFFLFLTVYSVFLGVVLVGLGSTFFSPDSFSVLCLCLLSVSGLPPFPLFFIKMAVVFNVFLSYGGIHQIILVLLFNVALVVGYLKFMFNRGVGANFNLALLVKF